LVGAFGQRLVIEHVPIPVNFWSKVKTGVVCHPDLHAAFGDWPVKP
jgi:hypothetical protein